MKTLFRSLVFICIATGLVACSADEPGNGKGDNNGTEIRTVDFKEISINDVDAEIAKGQNNFSVDFFAYMAKEKISLNDKKNFAVSPLSATMCMSMLANSTGAETSDAIVRMLGASDLQSLNDYNKKLLEYLPVYNDVMKLALANNIWFSNKYPGLDNNYVAKMSEVFNSSIQTVDFSNPATKDDINAWSKRNTFSMIPTIVDHLNQNTKMLLANALYFKSSWDEKFSESATKQESFNGINGTVTADMMHLKNNLCYSEADGAKFVIVPFKESRANMFFILPPEGTPILDYVSSFSNQDLSNFTNGISGLTEVTLAIPRFKSSANMILNDVFEKMGVDTYGMNIRPTGLGNESMNADISHFTAIEVNEEGAEAAAVTITDLYTSAPAHGKADFIANRPFAYFIVEYKTNTILMAGIVQDPTITE